MTHPALAPWRVAALTVLAMLAFAANSLLCRMALKHSAIDAMSFTSIRLVAGAVTLVLLTRLRAGNKRIGGDWPSAAALFVYAATFSMAYLGLAAATGALLLFGAVQLTMIGWGLWSGERPGIRPSCGILAAVAGLAAMLLPGANAPPLAECALMLASGVAWGIFSLRGRGVTDPLGASAGNLLRASAMALVTSLVFLGSARLDTAGCLYALASGALASGLGYAIWYAAVARLPAITAASVQLTVPVIAAAGAIVFLNEPLSARFLLTSPLVLGGVLLVLSGNRRAR